VSVTQWRLSSPIASVDKNPSHICCTKSLASEWVNAFFVEILNRSCSALCLTDLERLVCRVLSISRSKLNRSFWSWNLRRSSSIAFCLASSRSSAVSLSCLNLRRSSSSFAHVVAMAPNTATVPRMIANVLGSDGLIRIDDTSLI